jgi:peptidoglycan-N-acetylmuramic acid deacetylase
LCRECAELEKGNFYCKDSCEKEEEKPVQPDKEVSTKKPVEPEKKKSSILFKPNNILILASITFGICGITFGLIGLRINHDLAKQVDTMTEQQGELIAAVNKNRRQINTLKRVLKKRIDDERAANKKKTEKIITHKRKQTYKPEPTTYEYSSQKLPVSFDNGSTSKKLISLTFDGDSYCNVADAILDTLRSRKVKATMFLTGKFIRKFPNFVKKAIAEGHEVGNHTNTHPRMTSWKQDRTNKTLPDITEYVIARELNYTNDFFKKITGRGIAPLWRAPYGEKNRQISRWAMKYGYIHIGWKQARSWRYSHDTNDWIPDPETPGYRTPQEVLDKFNTLALQKPYGMNGAIILMHLGTRRKPVEEQVHWILGKMIDQLREKGYEFVPVSVMLKESGVDVSLLKKR